MTVWLLIWFLATAEGETRPGMTVTAIPNVATCRALVNHLAQRGIRAECVELIQS